jgi:hypothetical protein
MDRNQEAKLSFIRAFLDEANTRVGFLEELANTGHKPEAMTLCLVYIDRFAQYLCWPQTLAGRNFVDALVQFGGDPLMGLAHPLQAVRAFEAMNEPWKTLAGRIKVAFPGPSHELLPTSTFEEALKEYLTPLQLMQLKPELWRATIANVVYQHLRNPAIHGFGSTGGIILSQTTWNGQAVPELGLSLLKTCALGLIVEARKRSEANGQWFGNDAIVLGD